MTWTCEQAEARLSDYLDGLLSSAERLEFEAHAHSCANCAPLLASVSNLLSDLHSLKVMEPPAHLVYNILDKTLGPREAKGWRSASRWLGGLFNLRFAYGAISVAATLVILLTASNVNLRKAKLADFSPVNLYHLADQHAHIVYARSIKFVSDLRVVYEIQSRLSKDNELPTEPESTVPQPGPGKNPAVPTLPNPPDPSSKIAPTALAGPVKYWLPSFRS